MEINGGNGGLHGALKNVRREDCWLVDVDSFYPSIMIEYEWLPKCRHPERFKELLALKRSKMSEAKLMVNSVYGMMPEDMRLKICKKGQEIMMELINVIGGELIQVNTDGIIVKNPDWRALDASRWEIRHNLCYTKKHLKKLVQKDVNNYMYMDDAGEITIKGALRKTGIIGKAVAAKILNNTPIEKTVKAGALMDFCTVIPADIYYRSGVPHVCDYCRYVKIAGDAELTIDGVYYNNCDTVMGCTNNSEYPINYGWYINEAKLTCDKWRSI